MPILDRGTIWNHIVRRYGDATRISVDELEKSLRAENFTVDRNFIVGFFKELDQRGLASFHTGRRGHPSRALLNKKPKEVTSDMASASVEKPPFRTTLMEVPVPLRSAVTAKLLVPEDLSRAEADHIIEIVKRLPRPVSAISESGPSKTPEFSA